MKIAATDPISDTCKTELQKICEFSDLSEVPKEELPAKLSDFEAIIVRSKTKVTKELIDSAPNLKAVIRGGVGIDNIDSEYCKSKNIQVHNTPNAPSRAVAELSVTHMLSMLRNVPRADATTKAGEWLKKELKGRELTGKTVGIIGFGRIGYEVGRILNAFNCEILIVDPYAESNLISEVNGLKVELDELLEKSDILTIHVPLLDSTKGMLGAEQFKQMKNGVLIVNDARGPIVEEQALCDALSSGKVAMAALDVYWEKTPEGSCILEHKDKLVLTPHIGSATYEAQDRIGSEIVELVKNLS
ncbi:MAG: D-2-hydroxyacid dehydrogenase [Candidatus Undinarchaeales archaeon]|jgi:D-3-phosphoglycerate dehydrogenase|nr:D-2-hydroxyacid dehydrogenase [Candidatus Undinarchaeales archaeon]